MIWNENGEGILFFYFESDELKFNDFNSLELSQHQERMREFDRK